MNSKRYDGIDHPVRPVKDLRDLINSSCEMFADVDAYLYKDKAAGEFKGIKYSQVKEDMDALGTRFCDLGLKNKKIAVIGETSYCWFLTYYATVCGTGVIVPLDKNLPAEEVKNLVVRSKASAIVYSKKNEKTVKLLFEEPGTIEYFISMEAEEHGDATARSEEDKDSKATGRSGNKGAAQPRTLSLPKLIEEGKALVHQNDRTFIDAEINPDEMCSLLFTSGTTGQAKGVMLSHKNISSNVVNMSRREKLGDGFVILSILPTHHTFENTCVDWTTFYQGKTLAICEGIKYISKNMNEVHANCMVGVPLVFEKLHKGMMKQADSTGQGDKLRSAIQMSKRMRLFNNPRIMKRMFKSVHEAFGGEMQQFIAGGAAIDPEVIKDFEAMGIPMMQGYGMTECSPIIAVNQNNYSIAESVGRPMYGTTVRIDNPDRDGVGEIVCKGPSVMLGYYEDPEATAEVLRDGWLYTGDLGYMDAEGFLYVTGRKKTVIVTKGGKNIFPEEIEEILKQNDLIKEVLVHGVTDKRIGNVAVTADIQPNFQLLKERHGEMDSSQIYHFYKDLVDKVNDTMPPYKAIKRVNIREKDFEMTTTGKIKRYGNFTEGAEGAGSLSYMDTKKEEKRRAQEFLKEISDSENPAYRFKNGKPITDIRDLILRGSEEYGDRTALILDSDAGAEGERKEISYRQFAADINGLGTALINKGLAKKEMKIKGGLNYLSLVCVLASCCGIGRIEIAQGSPNECLLTADGTEIDVLAAIEEGKNRLAQGDRQYVDAEVLGLDGAVVFEGEEYSHTAIAFSIMAMASMLPITEEDTVFTVVSKDAIKGLVSGILLPLYRGAKVSFTGDYDKIVNALAEVRPTVAISETEIADAYKRGLEQSGKKGIGFGKLNLTKFFARELLNVFGGRLESIIINGAISKDTESYMRKLGLDTYQGYGVKECPGLVAIDAREDKAGKKAAKAGSLGHIIPGMGIKIIDKDRAEVGEICLAGEALGRPAGTGEDAETDGWIKTGDLGYVDEAGYVFVTGKVSDRFVGDKLGERNDK